VFRKVDDFLSAWDQESQTTLKVFNALTNASLGQRVADGHRTLGSMAWHITTSIPEMMGRTGIEIPGPSYTAPAPASVAEIASAYKTASEALAAHVKEKWSDETLELVDDMYGMQWARGMTLAALSSHEVHHRGQMTVLMRQAGLTVPGVYGPAKEEWAQIGLEAPPE
jgi:uncharacterized damage-inducible protein DinB